MNIAAIVNMALLDLGIPVDGVSIGDPDDRQTWRVDYRPEATPEQRTEGNALVLTIDVTDPTLVQLAADDVFAQRFNTLRPFIAALLQSWPQIQADVTAAGKLDTSIWMNRLRNNTLTQQRARGNADA